MLRLKHFDLEQELPAPTGLEMRLECGSCHVKIRTEKHERRNYIRVLMDESFYSVSASQLVAVVTLFVQKYSPLK